MDADQMFCPECRSLVVADRPPCADGHGESCPDRACTRCGAALTIDVVVIALPPRRRHRRAAA